jgi:hypothetical protein
MTRRATRADEAQDDPDDEVRETKVDRAAQARKAVATVRSRMAQGVWLLCVLAALVLAVGALCIALKANQDNNLVKFVIDSADKLDFGVFSRGKDGVAHWKGNTDAAHTKNALVNWGLAAVVWLVGGKVLERFVRP